MHLRCSSSFILVTLKGFDDLPLSLLDNKNEDLACLKNDEVRLSSPSFLSPFIRS